MEAKIPRGCSMGQVPSVSFVEFDRTSPVYAPKVEHHSIQLNMPGFACWKLPALHNIVGVQEEISDCSGESFHNAAQAQNYGLRFTVAFC